MSSDPQIKSNGSEGSDPAQSVPVHRAMPAASSSAPAGRSIGQLLGTETEAFCSAFLSPAEESDASATPQASKRQTSLPRRPTVRSTQRVPRVNSRGRPE
eukprot:350479-Heterocapsa_arctica.AAC.1